MGQPQEQAHQQQQEQLQEQPQEQQLVQQQDPQGQQHTCVCCFGIFRAMHTMGWRYTA